MMTVKRVCGAVIVAATLAVAAASPASAMVGPACDARLVPALGSSASCGFDSNTDWAEIAIEPTGTVTATVTCYTPYGSTTKSRTVSSVSTWYVSAYGSCTLTLTGSSVANASATPMLPPIYGPDPAA